MGEERRTHSALIVRICPGRSDLDVSAESLLHCCYLIYLFPDRFVVQAEKRQYNPVVNTELLIHFAQIVLNDLIRCAHLTSDLICASPRDTSDDSVLPRRQVHLGARVQECSSLCSIGFEL